MDGLAYGSLVRAEGKRGRIHITDRKIEEKDCARNVLF